MKRISIAKLHAVAGERKPGYVEAVLAASEPDSETHVRIADRDFNRIRLQYSLHAEPRYARPKRHDIAVVIPFFSPVGYQKPLVNLAAVRADLASAGIPHYVAEMVYDTPKTSPPHTLFRSSSPMFHKENICNLMARRLPPQYTKIVFLDGDLRFSRKDWLDACSEVLDTCDVATPMQDCSWLGEQEPRDTIPATAVAASQGGGWIPGRNHPGFAIAVRRDWFDAAGGLYDESYLGSGDVAFWQAVTGREVPGGTLSAIPKDTYMAWRANLPPARIGYVRNCRAHHMPHGRMSNRQYVTRAKDFRIKGNLVRTPEGVLEFDNDDDRQLILGYFQSRKEDGEQAGPGTELKKLLSTIGIHASPTCKCNAMARKMDEWGQESLNHMDEIVAVMEETAKKRKLPFSRIAAKSLVRLACWRARRGNGS